MTTCVKNESIVISGCPDWTQLSWGVGFFQVTVGTGTAVFVPNGAGVTDSFQDVVTNNNPGDQAVCRNGATVSYTGGACNCILNFTWLNTLPAGSSGSITITGNFPAVIVDLFTTGSGVYGVPFTVPDTGGLPVALGISVIITAAAPGTGAGNVTGNVANV